jgi:hypothetical protein
VYVNSTLNDIQFTFKDEKQLAYFLLRYACHSLGTTQVPYEYCKEWFYPSTFLILTSVLIALNNYIGKWRETSGTLPLQRPLPPHVAWRFQITYPSLFSKARPMGM